MNTDPHWEQFKIAVAEILRARLERMAQDAEVETVGDSDELRPHAPSVTVKSNASIDARRAVRKGGAVYTGNGATAVNEIPQGA